MKDFCIMSAGKHSSINELILKGTLLILRLYHRILTDLGHDIPQETRDPLEIVILFRRKLCDLGMIPVQ
jgi:hypothetical protein